MPGFNGSMPCYLDTGNHPPMPTFPTIPGTACYRDLAQAVSTGRCTFETELIVELSQIHVRPSAITHQKKKYRHSPWQHRRF